MRISHFARYLDDHTLFNWPITAHYARYLRSALLGIIDFNSNDKIIHILRNPPVRICRFLLALVKPQI